MRPTLLLRIGSAIALLFALGHNLGGLDSWSPPGETEVLGSMKTFRFEAMGVSRTYWDFYMGFGLFIGVYLLLQAALLWQLASLAVAAPARARPMMGSLFVASLAGAALAFRFIFPAPAVFSIAIAACVGLAWLAASRYPKEASSADGP
jgi:hypothetical protein